MQARAHPFGRAVPRFEPLRISIRLIAPAQDFGLDSRMTRVVVLRFENVVLVHNFGGETRNVPYCDRTCVPKSIVRM